MLHLLDLHNNLFQAHEKALGIVVVKNVEVYTLASASKKCLVIAFRLDASPYCRKYKCPGVYCLQVTSRHLKHHRVGCRDDRDNLCTSLDTPASLILLWFVCRYFEI